MNRSNKSFNQVLTRLLGDARRPADGDMDADITRVRERIGPPLQAEPRRMPKGLITDTAALPSRDRTMPRAWNLPFAAAAAVMFALALGILLWPSGSAAVVEAADNGLTASSRESFSRFGSDRKLKRVKPSARTAHRARRSRSMTDRVSKCARCQSWSSKRPVMDYESS